MSAPLASELSQIFFSHIMSSTSTKPRPSGPKWEQAGMPTIQTLCFSTPASTSNIGASIGRERCLHPGLNTGEQLLTDTNFEWIGNEMCSDSKEEPSLNSTITNVPKGFSRRYWENDLPRQVSPSA